MRKTQALGMSVIGIPTNPPHHCLQAHHSAFRGRMYWIEAKPCKQITLPMRMDPSVVYWFQCPEHRWVLAPRKRHLIVVLGGVTTIDGRESAI